MNANPDHDLDRILHALRTVAPPLGMEQRLLERMQNEPAAHFLTPETGFQRFKMRWFGHPAFASSVAAAAITAVALVVLHGFVPHPRVPAASVRTSEAGRVTPEAPVARLTMPPPVRFVPPSHRLQTKPEPSLRSVAHRRQALSYPAPEAPLTAQEKLLQQIARTGGEQEFAMLNPEMRALQETKERADFEAFTKQTE